MTVIRCTTIEHRDYSDFGLGMECLVEVVELKKRTRIGAGSDNYSEALALVIVIRKYPFLSIRGPVAPNFIIFSHLIPSEF